MKLIKHTGDPEIPTSSMADIAFLLIVYFMVTATFSATRGLDFSLPKDDDNPPIVEKEDSVLIELQPSGEILVDQKVMQLDEIFEYLKPKLEANPKKPVIIRSQPTAPYKYMLEVFDALRKIKIKTQDDGTREVYTVTLADIQQADKKPEEGAEPIDLGKDVNVSIPTQREIDSFWF
jgi:biopolymer transport protein ExbD